VYQVEGTECVKAHRQEVAGVLQRAGTLSCLVWLDMECRLGSPGDEARGRQAQMVQYLMFQPGLTFIPQAGGSPGSPGSLMAL
jgi:hypothetical protein